MMALSEEEIKQIHETAKDRRLQHAEQIITPLYGRAMHSAAEGSYRRLTENHGKRPEGAQCLWEPADEEAGPGCLGQV